MTAPVQRVVGVPGDEAHDPLAAAVAQRPGHVLRLVASGDDAASCDVVVAMSRTPTPVHGDVRRYLTAGPVNGPDVAACRHQLVAGRPAIVAPLPVDDVVLCQPTALTVAVAGEGDAAATVAGAMADRGCRVVPVSDPHAGVVAVVEPVEVGSLRRWMAEGRAVVAFGGDMVAADTINHRSEGVLVEGITALVEEVVALARDGDERARIGLEASLAIREASWARLARALLADRAPTSGSVVAGLACLLSEPSDPGRVRGRPWWSTPPSGLGSPSVPGERPLSSTGQEGLGGSRNSKLA